MIAELASVVISVSSQEKKGAYMIICQDLKGKSISIVLNISNCFLLFIYLFVCFCNYKVILHEIFDAADG